MTLSLPPSTIDVLQQFLFLVLAAACAWYLVRVLAALTLLALARAMPGYSQLAIGCAPGAMRPWVRRAVASGLLGAAAIAAPSAMAAEPGCPTPDGIPTLDRSEQCSLELATEQTQPPPDTYSVVRGDSLWSISAAFLGEAANDQVAKAWPELWEANHQVIGDDPRLIQPGMVLVVPEGLQR